MWNKLKKKKITSFKDETGRICWSFYYEDLKKLFKPRINKWAKKSNDKIIDSQFHGGKNND